MKAVVEKLPPENLRLRATYLSLCVGLKGRTVATEIAMSLTLALTIGVIVTATSFLSGLFGMAGGLILIGALLALLPVATAMVLHAIRRLRPTPGGAFSGASTLVGGLSRHTSWVAPSPCSPGL